jgi:IS30 family transposase
VSREVNRNGGRTGYRASRAQRASDERARRPKARKLMVKLLVPRRRPRRRGDNAKRRNVLGDIAPISAQSPEASHRALPGHREGDLIMGAFNRSAIVTEVERRSRFLLLGTCPRVTTPRPAMGGLLERSDGGRACHA